MTDDASTALVWTTTATGRRDLADLLDTLTPAELTTESLCQGWDVRTVAAHLAEAAAPSLAGFALAVLRARGRVHEANDQRARLAGRRPASEIAQLLRSRADSQIALPVTGARAALTEVLVHGGDIRLPLGRSYDPEPARVRPALEFVTTGRTIGFVPRGRLDGLGLQASDLDWVWGAGAPVTGRAVDLLMAACGRTAVLGRLGGDGVAVLTSRLNTSDPRR